MTKNSNYRVQVGDLRWRCNPDRLGFESTDEIPCCREIFGQDRALNAISLGLEIKSPGYNLYVSGLTGTGKSTTVQQILRQMRKKTKELLDISYVHNFQTPDMPVCLTLPAGRGVDLKKAMADLLKLLREHIPQVLDSEDYSKGQKKVVEELKKQRVELANALEKVISEKGFQLLEVQFGPFTRPVILPLIDGKPVEIEKLNSKVEAGEIKKKDAEKLNKAHEELMTKMQEFLKLSRELDRKISEKVLELTRQFVEPIVDACIDDVKDRFPHADVHDYLAEVRRYSLDNIEIFSNPDDPDEDKSQPKFIEFQVNVIVDNSRSDDIPVIIETAPTYINLFGTIDRVVEGRSEFRTDFTMIRAGSLLRANGGFLVLNLIDIFEEPGVWPALKRALKNQSVTIQGIDSLFLGPTSAQKPEAIDLDVKVVLIGDAESYQILYHYDEDFRKIFKIKADFDTEMPNNQDNIQKYTQFVRNITDEEDLLSFHKSAVATVSEEGARMAGRQDKLSTRFSDVADIVREADFWARKSGKNLVMSDDVEKAVEERIERVNLTEEKMNEMLADGIILLDVDGAKVGQVNGLSVYDFGDHSFGKPVRITVETSMGRAGIINIERESELSGKTYNKGSLILEGYLRRRFAQDKPLAMSASICFEQSYGGIDGDSASSTEVYALLSSLADLPLRQDLAVTGSVNQKGEIQPIGGVNEKIHGFYDLCKLKGLTGNQGVIIPKLNKNDLMLRKDVVEKIEQGKFHLFAVETIDQGIEILTGKKAGNQKADGSFDKGSVNFLANDKLARFAEQLKEFADGGDE